MPPQSAARDNPRASRYEIDVDGQLAIAEYFRDGSTVTFTHTFVPASLRRHGLASRLIVTALDDARKAGLTVVPRCEAFAGYMREHVETHALLGLEGRALLGL